MTQHLL